MRTDRIWTGLSAIVLFLIAVLGGLGLVVVLIWPWWVPAAVLVAALILAVPVYLIRRWRSGGHPGWSPTRAYASTAVVTVLVLSALVAFPVYFLAYMIDARPTLAPLVTLSNGKKTVQFQGMQHIGAEGFYKSVIYDLHEALGNGYRLYYEGVQPVDARPDLTAWFNSFATEGGGSDLSEFYKSLADSCGLTFQLDYFKGLKADEAVHPQRHVTADVTYLDLKTEFDRLMREDPEFARAFKSAAQPVAAKPSGDAKVFKTMLTFWKAATPDQKRLIGLACRGFLSWIFAQTQSPIEKDKLILDFRNKRLARTIVDDTAPKIWITYGSRHITGVIAELQKLDPGWRIEAIKWSRTIANPENHHGELTR